MAELKDDNCITLSGVRVNNLKDISLTIPRNRLVVLTGISGSGKSSLAFDTLYAEGQRRYAESISAFARQFLGRMSKPDADIISGLPPAVAIGQRVTTRNPRSTVASSTEIYDYLRLLFARIGHTFSPVSGREVTCDTARSVTEYIFSHGEVPYVLLGTEFGWEDADGRTERLLGLKAEGYSRVFAPDGTISRIDEVLQDLPRFADRRQMLLLIARLATEDNEENRSIATDSIETAFNHAEGTIYVLCGSQCRQFSNRFEADGITFIRPDEFLFSYNSPIGACPECGGFGKVMGIDEDLVVPDKTLSIYEDAVNCWKGATMQHFRDQVIMSAEQTGFPIHRPYNKLTPEEKDLLWRGCEHFTGIMPFFEWIDSQRHKIQYRYLKSRYSGKTVCRTCGGSRLRPEALYVRVGGYNIHQLMKMTIGEVLAFFRQLPEHLDDYDRSVAQRPIQEIVQRLSYIDQVGLSYLTLDRASNTLSGGESQRISLVSSLGNNLVGSMYILDEPSIGLHPRDTQRLIGVLRQLRDLGNTVIVVEHDEQIIRSADMVIDIGPLAGKSGGQIVFQGDAKEEVSRRLAHPDEPCRSLTIDYLAGLRKVSSQHQPRGWKYSVTVRGAMQHNLKDIDVRFPLRCLTVVTGVSGSGKSSLVGEILYPALYRQINEMGDRPGLHRALEGDLSRIAAVEYIDQNPIGKSTRSNPATYLKIYDDIRRLFSEQPYAKMNGFGHSHFSFNIEGGRCPECSGEGEVKISMQFMADIRMVCETCHGRRFKDEILEVKYAGLDISQVLEMSVEEAIAFFGSQKDELAQRIARKLQPLMDVGLSYVSLGQSSSTLSGGESQRIKLASFLMQDSPSRSMLFIFDEPTTGLHFYDVEKLLKAFDALISRGHSIIVVEHNLDVIRSADWVIELGPDAGDRGGELIFEGTPEELKRHGETPTGAALA